MKIWKSLLILFLSVLLVGGGYWAYSNYFSVRRINSLEVISQNAVFVFESHNGAETWNKLVDDPSWEILKNLPAFQGFSDQLTKLDSLHGGSGAVAKALRGTQATFSLHSTGAESFDILYTIKLKASSSEKFIQEVKSRIPVGARFQNRKYSDIDVLEYYDADNNRQWSLSLIGDLAVISSTSFLVEEAIRFYVNADQLSFFSLVQSHPYDSGSLGRLLISGRGFASLIKGIGNERTSNGIAELENLQAGAIMNLELVENKLLFRGELVYPEEVNFTPSIQANLATVESAISNRTLALTQINLESIFESQKLVNRAFVGRATYSGDIQRKLVDLGFLDSFTGELYLLDLENSGGSSKNLALLARTTAVENALQLLREFQENEEDAGSDYYDGHEILYIAEEDFPAHLFAGKFHGFNQSFITAEGELLIITNSQQGMKMVLDDIRSGNTWKSANAPEAKKELSPTAGFTRIYLTPKILESWISKSNPSWSTFLQKYSDVFRSFPWISFKINQIQNHQEATFTLAYDGQSKPKIKTDDAVALQPSKQISFGKNLIYGPKSIRNYQDNTEDIVVQDENYVLHLVNSAGEVIYSEQLDGPVISDAFQIDYYKNDKLQLLLATPNRVYGIDRLGNPLTGYPFSISGETISSLNLVDYSNTKDYRYFISTAQENLYLLDQTGQQLEGWNPNPIGTRTIGPAHHVRVPGKGDYMVALGENGQLRLFNRRGEEQSGSSAKLGSQFKSSLISWRNPSSRTTLLVGITSNGEVIHVNFNGEVSYRNQLIKEDRDSEFLLVPDQKQNDFVFISRQFNEVAVLNRSENKLFSARVSAENLVYQYFDFGSDRQLIAITDLIQQFSYLYDLNGKLVTTMPLNSDGEIQITHQISKGQYLIRTVNGNMLTEFQLAD